MANVTVLTGGTSGIGKAIALKLLKMSEDSEDKLFVIYGHNDQAAFDMQNAFSEIDRKKTFFIKADLSNYKGIDIVGNEVRKRVEHVDWMILNTGISSYKPFEEYTPELWEHIMRTNVNIPVFLVKEFKDMINDEGSILFMGSHAGQATYSSSLVYSTSKAAIMFAARSMVKIFENKLIRVNTIAPGFIETRWQKDRSDESRNRINRKIAAHRFGHVDEVADLSYHILNNKYLNGSVYDIHGGYDYF